VPVTRALSSDRFPEMTDISPVNWFTSRTARILSSSPVLQSRRYLPARRTEAHPV
jgi:hypothetical protein